MKFSFNKFFDLKRGYRILLWAALHLILIFFAFRAFPFKINTDLLSILPDLIQSREISEIEDVYNNRLGSEMTILVGADDFQTAKSLAEEYYKQLKPLEGIQDLSFEMDPGMVGAYQNLLFKYRYSFLSPDTRALLEQNDIQSLSERALMSIYSPVSMGTLDYLEDDPFLISTDNLFYFMNQSLASNTALSVKDSVLTTRVLEKDWILISMNLTDSGLEVEVDENPVARIWSIQEELQKSNPQAEILLSGAPFHSYQSTIQSKRQITAISTISSIFIVLLILFVYRSLIPLVSTVLAISFGILSGLAATVSLFQEIHIFTIVFGTSLIGISVDYAFHYFSEWSETDNDVSPVLKKVVPGISLGLITTIVSYAAFTISSFPLLQQMAVFSITGLSSTYLTVILLFPYLKKPGSKTRLRSTDVLNKILRLSGKMKLSRLSFKILIVGISLLLFTGMSDFHLSTSLSDLYKMTDQLKHWEEKSANLLAHQSSGVHFIITAEDLESCLQIEEELKNSLSILEGEEDLKSSMSLSHFLPSLKTQDYNITLSQNRLLPNLPAQKEILGIQSNEGEDFIREYLQLKALDDILPSSLMKGLHIGQVDDLYATSILLFGIKNIDALYDLAGKTEGVTLIDRVGQTEDILKNLSVLMIRIILASYSLIFGGLILRYGFRKASYIIGIPLMASLICLSVFTLLNIPVNLFVIVALILIPGMGTDYLIILFESGPKGRSLLSITMSFATTALSFGMLCFASITSLFGMTVFMGLVTSYLLTLFLTADVKVTGYVPE